MSLVAPYDDGNILIARFCLWDPTCPRVTGRTNLKPDLRAKFIAAWRSGPIGTRVPTPFLVVEILSPEDRVVRMQPKIQEYLGIGINHVWLIDAFDRKALTYSQEDPVGKLTDVLKTVSPHLEISLETLWKFLPES